MIAVKKVDGRETRLPRRETSMEIIYYVSIILAVLNTYMLFFNKARMTGRWPFILSYVVLAAMVAQGPVSKFVGPETWHDWLTNPNTRELMRFWTGWGSTALFIVAACLTVGGLWHDGDLRRSYTYKR
jgi:hypothetical protein